MGYRADCTGFAVDELGRHYCPYNVLDVQAYHLVLAQPPGWPNANRFCPGCCDAIERAHVRERYNNANKAGG